MFRLDLLQNDRVRYANQPIAVVIAETLEAATEGAALLAPRYETEPARVGLDDAESFVPPGVGVGTSGDGATRRRRGGPRGARRGASRRPTRRRRNTTTRWSRMRSSPPGTATACPSTRRARASRWRRAASPGLFGIAPENIHIRSPFLGGGFGSKGLISGPQVLGIMAARLVGQAGQAGAAPRADVRPGRPSRADAADDCASAPTARAR